MRWHSVGCGTPGQTPSEMQSDTPNTAADYIEAMIRVYDESGNANETHEHKGEFKSRRDSTYGIRTLKSSGVMTNTSGSSIVFGPLRKRH
jgi:hypothetical protein